MSKVNSLAKRLEEVFLNGRWIANTNWQDQLQNVDLKMATTQVSSWNTIAMLTFHINYYLEGIMEVFEGGELTIRDKYSFDLPPIKTESDWENLRSQLARNAQMFIEHVRSMKEETLIQPFVKKEYGSYERNIEGVIEHSYYHLGQAALIRKEITKDK